MDAVGLELHQEFTMGSSTQLDVERFLAEKNWPIINRLTNEECRTTYGDSILACPGGDRISVSVPVSSGVCGWFGRSHVYASLGFDSISSLIFIGTSMEQIAPIKLCRWNELDDR
jgi:hypothetical protein